MAIADESAVIVWDEASRTEHFVRRASFRTDVKDFGFLVPTPSKPELAEASDATFASLEKAIVPEVIETHHLRFEPNALVFMTLARRMSGEIKASAVAPVRVLEEKRVAGYDAVVLEADDAGALERWLKDHGYAQRPALASWLAPYVQKKWKLTAFKVADDEAAATRSVGTNAVRMSFTTDRPFFPYREPSDQRESQAAGAPSRSLRVFFVGQRRVDATIGEGQTTFPGKTVWAGPLAVGNVALPVVAPPNAWLTVFHDDASPRPGIDELWFATSKDQGPVKPPPIVVEAGTVVPIPLDVIGLVGVVVGVLVVRRRRSRGGGRR